MAKQYTININNGTGTEKISNGVYNATATSNGYDASTLDPKSITVNAETNTFDFKIGATGTLTLHITETGEASGTPIVGATFVRCDSTGNTYGNPITTNEQGNAVFNNVPFDANNAPAIYYKQTQSDSTHDFDNTLKNTTLTESTKTVEVQNPAAATKTVNLTDANYSGLKIESAQITLSEQV